MIVALLGSGEFEAWTERVDRWALERATGDGSVLILPTASAPEGDGVFDRWAAMGLDHYTRMGVEAEVLRVRTREDAEDQAIADRLGTASMVFFSGGNPAYLASTVRETALWSAVLFGMQRGMAYSGCSAGVASLGDIAPDAAAVAAGESDPWKEGLGLFPGVLFGPHWDVLERYRPGLSRFFRDAVPDGSLLVAIDERTAMVGDGTEWQVMGTGGVHLLDRSAWREYRSGQSFSASLDSRSAI